MALKDAAARKAYNREAYLRNREARLRYAREQHEARKDDPEYRARKAAYKRKYYERNKDKAKARAAAWYREHYNEARARNKAYYEANKHKLLPKNRADSRKRLYGVSVEQYGTMLESQCGGCAICGREPGRARALAVDHCHATNVNRGLLCDSCNTALGVFFVPELCERAMVYLKSYSSFPDTRG